MIIRLTGIIFILICGAMTGIKASDRLKNYYRNCTLLIEAVNRIGIMIRYRSLSVYEIARELKKSDTLSDIEFIRNLPEEFENESFQSVWKSALKEDKSIGKEEKNLLNSFAESFGSSDTQGQLSAIALLSEGLKSTEQKRGREYEEKGRLYRSLGLIAGIMMGIMIV